MTFQKTSVAIAVSLALGCVGNAHADQASDMQAKLDALQKEIQELQAQIGALRKERAQAALGLAALPARPPANEVKAGKELVFKVGGGEVQLYGHADVSLDDQTNGMTGFLNGGLPVTGHNGWVPDVSSNLSFFGVRGNRAVSDDLKGVFQFETEISYAATPGASDQAPDTTAQKFELGSRNSFVGLQSEEYGAIKLGKTDTPYKTATARLDPFASTPGDYNAIMGNSGGDHRNEIALSAPPFVWFQCPKIHGGGAHFLRFTRRDTRDTNDMLDHGQPGWSRRGC